jgi:uncharacterized protein
MLHLSGRLSFIAVLSLAAASAGAAGFNCAKAIRAAERAICENADLSAMDSQQAGLYAGLLAAIPAEMADPLRATQRVFLAERNGCQANTPCLQSAYLFRFHELCGIAKLFGRSCADNGEQPR